ncbi:hypothetical protein OQA88_7073 [Cercophora sp. LCS_1]
MRSSGRAHYVKHDAKTLKNVNELRYEGVYPRFPRDTKPRIRFRMVRFCDVKLEELSDSADSDDQDSDYALNLAEWKKEKKKEKGKEKEKKGKGKGKGKETPVTPAGQIIK